MLEILAAAERIDDQSVGKPASDRVDREVPACEIVFDGRRRIDDDLEVVPAGACRLLAPRRCELDPRGCNRSKVAVTREQPHTDGSAGDDQILDPSVGLEHFAEPEDVDSQNEEVGVLGLEAEQLVTYGAADDVGGGAP